MDKPIRQREPRSQERDCAIARMAHLSWKSRYANGGYWSEIWRHRPGGGRLRHRLRWCPCVKARG